MSFEIWKELIREFPGYWISNMGRLKMYNGYISHASPEDSGYVRPGMKNKEGKKVKRSMHVLVATAFIPNPEDKPFVCHVNRNRADNRVENLMWCTKKEKEIRRIKHKEVSGKAINQMTLDGILY